MKFYAFTAKVLVFLAATSIYAETPLKPAECLVCLRDLKTEAGLYKTSRVNNTLAEKVADLTPESIQAYLDQNPDLKPRIAYVDSDTMKFITNPLQLQSALSAGRAMPVWDEKEFIFRGLPLFDTPFLDSKRSDFLATTRAKLAEQYPDLDLSVRSFGTPSGPLKPLQNILAFSFLPQDIQSPTPFEERTTYYKLLMSNGSQQLIVWAIQPLASGTIAGAVNFANSYGTGRYIQTLTNWSNRSANNWKRFKKKAALGAFFTIDLGWAGVGSWEKFKNIATVGGWSKFIRGAYFGFGISLFYRYLFEESLNKWQASKNKEGRGEEARRTATNLKFLATMIGTPALLYTITHQGVGLHIPYTYLPPVNLGHAVMLTMAAYSLPYFRQKKSWDPWIERIDALNWNFSRDLERTRLPDLVRKLKSGYQNRFGKGAQEIPPLNDLEIAKVRKFLNESDGISPEFQKNLQSNPQLSAALEKDRALFDLISAEENSSATLNEDVNVLPLLVAELPK